MDPIEGFDAVKFLAAFDGNSALTVDQAEQNAPQDAVVPDEPVQESTTGVIEIPAAVMPVAPLTPKLFSIGEGRVSIEAFAADGDFDYGREHRNRLVALLAKLRRHPTS